MPAIVDLRRRTRAGLSLPAGLPWARVGCNVMLGASGVLMGTRFYAASRLTAPSKQADETCGQQRRTVRGVVFDGRVQLLWPAPFPRAR